MYSNTSDLSGSSDTGVQVTATTYCSCATERLLLDAQQHLVASWKPFWSVVGTNKTKATSKL